MKLPIWNSETCITVAVAGVFALAGLIVLSAYNTWAFPIDDAFISFRYARNLIHGYGLVFNQGERVEAYSNFLWVLLVSGLGTITGISQIVAARILGLASLTGACVLIFAQIRRATGTLFLPFLVGLVFMLLPATIFHTLSGMETMLSLAFLLGVGVVVESDRLQPRRKAWLAGLLLAAFSLNRPEGLFLFACIFAVSAAAWLFNRTSSQLDPKRLVVSYACVVLPFLVWRLFYYGSLLPNSVLAKGGSLHPLVFKAGAKYVGWFLIWHAPVILLVVVFFFFARGVRWVPFRIPASAALAATALMGGVGDGYPYSRYLYPLFGCLLVWSVEGGLSLWQWAKRSRALAAASLALLSFLGLIQMGLLYREHFEALPVRSQLDFLSRPAGFFRDTPASANPEFLREGLGHYQAGEWLREHSSPADLLATYEIGIIPYVSGLPTLDLFGLADRHIARSPGLPGQRTDLPYVWSRRPRFIMLRVPSDCLCSTYQIFFDRRFRDDYDLAGLFPYWTTDILIFKRRAEPVEDVVFDPRDGLVHGIEGPIRLIERVQLMWQGEEKILLPRIRQTHSPEAMRRWIDTWRSAFTLPASNRAEQGTVSFDVVVPEHARLAFGVGTSPSQDSKSEAHEGKARVEVAFSTENYTVTLFERDFDAKTLTWGWEDYQVGLKAFAGQRATLSFKISNPGIPVTVGVAEPRIINVNQP